jgi:hypothetical protein
MASKKYPQFLLLGDSIIQQSSFLRDGFSFGAGLEERESQSDRVMFCIGLHVPFFLLLLKLVSDLLVDCQRRLDVVNRGLVSGGRSQTISSSLSPDPSTEWIQYRSCTGRPSRSHSTAFMCQGQLSCKRIRFSLVSNPQQLLFIRNSGTGVSRSDSTFP